MTQRRAFLSLPLGLLAPTFPAFAQDRYPVRPIRVLLPLRPGSTTDMVAPTRALPRVSSRRASSIQRSSRRSAGSDRWSRPAA